MRNEDIIREVEQFLYREARLLDTRRFHEWLELFTDDVMVDVANRTVRGYELVLTLPQGMSRERTALLRQYGARVELIDSMGGMTIAGGIAAALFAIALARQGGFHALLLAGFQIEGVALDLLDDFFTEHQTLETTQRALQSFAVLKVYFCHFSLLSIRPNFG